jgi:hypothetical protein
MTLSREQTAIARAELTLGRMFGVGGGSWTVTRALPLGVDPALPADEGTWTGYVTDAADPRQASAAPGPPVVRQQWEGVAAGDAITLHAGDVLTSAEDTTIRFTVVGAHLVAGYAKYTLEAL